MLNPAYLAVLNRQGGRCASCMTEESPALRFTMHYDEERRFLICPSCAEIVKAITKGDVQAVLKYLSQLETSHA